MALWTYSRRCYEKLKEDVYRMYGDKCACCGETERVFFALDHVENDGAQHRKTVSRGYGVYKAARDANDPKRFQILCHNCNFAKSNGGCPHKR